MAFVLSLTALLAFALLLGCTLTTNHPDDRLRHLRHLSHTACRSIRRVVQAVPDTAAPVYVNATSSSWLDDAASFNAAPLLASVNHPVCATVAFARTTADVVTAVGYAVYHGMPVQARSGRHSYLAFASATENALVVDLGNLSAVGRVQKQAKLWRMPSAPSALSKLEVDNDVAHVVTVGAGARLFYLADELSDQGFVFPGGSCPTVGTGGFALGGGYGFFSRAYGMASDNIVGATIVQVDAAKNVITRRLSLLRDAAVEEPSMDDLLLLWALRGGGNNNFGIVTELVLRVYPAVPKISHWRIDFPGKQACVDALAMYQQKIITDVVDKQSTHTSTVTYQLNVYRNYFCSVLAVGYGMSKDDLQTEMASWKTLPNATSKESEPTETDKVIDVVVMLAGCDSVTACRTVTANHRPDPHNPSYWGAMTSYVFSPLNESAAGNLVDVVNSSHSVTAGFSVLMLDAYGGQIRDHGRGKHENTSAFTHHDALYHAQILSYFSPIVDDDDGKGDGEKEGGITGAEQWQLAVFDTLDETQSVHGSYRNYPSDLFGKAKQWQYSALARYYGDNLASLQNVKRQVDPHGVFSYSQGV